MHNPCNRRPRHGLRLNTRTCEDRSTSNKGAMMMLQQPTLEKLEAMRLHGMAQALRELSKSEQAQELSFDERLALLVDRQLTWRQNEAMQARLRRAKPARRRPVPRPGVGACRWQFAQFPAAPG